MNSIKLTALGLSLSAILVGCGGGDSSSDAVGYFVDSPVANLAYHTSSNVDGITDQYGRFQFKYGEKVEYRIGNLVIGSATPDDDGLVTPSHLYAQNEDHRVLLLRVLQSLDTDHDLSNGITIPDNLFDEINQTNLSDLNESTLLELNHGEIALHIDLDFDGHIDKTEDEAKVHFEGSMTVWESGHRADENESGNGNGNGNGNGHGGGDSHSFDINILPVSILTQDLKDALAYMGNEERLAYDIYMNLYQHHSANGVEIKQLYNIATKSEERHVGIVQSAVQKYSLGADDVTNVVAGVASNTVAFEDMPRGQYDIPAIQSLYDDLYAKGTSSQREALEVGCMVEVTDINDLDGYIATAESSNASDVKDAFNILRDGSYKHYWAFDKGLKNIGVSDGCCSLGTINGVNYCHTEYPQN